MLILTIQKKDIVDKIYEGSYSPDFWRSDYSLLSSRFAEGYVSINRALQRKTGEVYSPLRSCYWGWVYNPYLDFFCLKRILTSFVGLFVDIPADKVVLSDYDKFSSYIVGDSNDKDYFLTDERWGKSECIQASFMELKRENILYAIPLNMLDGLRGDLSGVWISGVLRSRWVELNSLHSKVAKVC